MPQSCYPGCSLCCRYVAVPIDKPRSRTAIDSARWMLSHRDVWLTVDATRNWHVQFLTRCEHLDVRTSRCGIYEERFEICRSHDLATCEGTVGEGSEPIHFRTVQEFDAYLAARKERGARRGRSKTERL